MIFTTLLCNRCSYTHFSVEETEAKRGSRAPGLVNWKRQDLNPGPNSRPCALSYMLSLLATEDLYRQRKNEHRKNVKVTHQPELLEEGDEAVQDAVDPVHCSETKRKVTELCASSGDPGVRHPPAYPWTKA